MPETGLVELRKGEIMGNQGNPYRDLASRSLALLNQGTETGRDRIWLQEASQ